MNSKYPIHQKLLPSNTYNSSSSLQNVRLSRNNNNYNQIKTPSTTSTRTGTYNSQIGSNRRNLSNNINKNEPMENLDPTSEAFYYVWLSFGILVIALMGYNSYLMKDFSENADNYTTKEVISMTKNMEHLKLGTFIAFTISLGSLLAYVAYSSIRSDHHNSLKTIRPFAIGIVVFYGIIYLYGIAIQLINMFKNDLSLVFTLYEIYIGLIGLIIFIKLIKAFVMNRTIRHVRKEKENMRQIQNQGYQRNSNSNQGNQRNSNSNQGNQRKSKSNQGNQIYSNPIPGNQRKSKSNQGNQIYSNPIPGVTGMTRQSLKQPTMVRRNQGNQMVQPY